MHSAPKFTLLRCCLLPYLPLQHHQRLLLLQLVAMRTEVLLLAVLVAAAALLSSLDSRSDVRLLEIGDGDLELVPLDGAAGPESIIFDKGGEGPFTGVSDGRVLRRSGGGRSTPARRRSCKFLCPSPSIMVAL